MFPFFNEDWVPAKVERRRIECAVGSYEMHHTIAAGRDPQSIARTEKFQILPFENEEDKTHEKKNSEKDA